MAVAVEVPVGEFVQRQTLSIAEPTAGAATHAGDEVFNQLIQQHYQRSESNAAEKLIALKAQLRELPTEAFWTRLMEGLTDICGAQFGFVSKRILVDDQNSAVEMPLIGQVGSCLMGVALYYNNGQDIKGMHHDYKYYAWSAPCAYMKHDKVFLMPQNLHEFFHDNPNTIPFDCSSYLGVPLFAEGKCFAHFGMMWTDEGLIKKQGLSWAYIEMLMHSLEDMVCDRLLTGQGFTKESEPMNSETAKVIPHSAITAAQSLKPYARSLSHELRTPMQGVVGMLDVMYATVQEQIEGQASARVRKIFQELKQSIEMVQDSSKRAVEAADNVVHAYDLNMQVPDTPLNEAESPAQNNVSSYFDVKPSMGEGSKIVNAQKRKASQEPSWTFGNATKRRDTKSSPLSEYPEMARSPLSTVTPAGRRTPVPHSPLSTSHTESLKVNLPKTSPMSFMEKDSTTSTPSTRQCVIRELIPIVIHDSLRVGGRPDSTVSIQIENGERIEVRTRSSNGYASSKIVEYHVDPDIPEVLPFEERDISKLISAVFLNAIKFTENGTIKMFVKHSRSGRHILVNIIDTGIGIPEAFQPELFKPFSQEDDSLTRTKEGLGLGLLVAKGLARRIAGDITLVRSRTEGPDKGSEFEIKILLDPNDVHSRAGTPLPSTEHNSVPRSVSNNLRDPFGATTRKASSPLEPVSPSRVNTQSIPTINKFITSMHATKQSALRRTSLTSTPLATKGVIDRELSTKYPLKFLVAEDNKINRKLLVNMLNKLGYKNVHEAFDGREAVRIVSELAQERELQTNGRRRSSSYTCKGPVLDVILMDLWMPELDGYQASQQIFEMFRNGGSTKLGPPPSILAVSADVTDGAIEKATTVGMQGYMTKPFKLLDLQRLIMEFCIKE